MTLRVTLEIVPFGDESKKHVIRQLDIFNMGHIEGTANDRYGVIHIDQEKILAAFMNRQCSMSAARGHGDWSDRSWPTW